MNIATSNGAWQSVVALPETRRLAKPRSNGITMVIDKGLGLRETAIYWKWQLTTSISLKSLLEVRPFILHS